MESRKGDRLNKKEIHADNPSRKSGYFVMPSDCMRAELLLDDYVFSRDDVSYEDAAFLDAHIRNCQECKIKYTELIQWKNLLTSAKYKAPENLRKSVIDYINEEHKKNTKRISFKKNMFRFSAAAASVLMLTASVYIISIINKNPMSDSMSTQNDMLMYSDSLTEAAGEYAESGLVEEDESLDKSYTYFSFDNDMGESDDNKSGMYLLPSEEEEYTQSDAVSPETPVEAEAPQYDAEPGGSILENQKIAEEEPEYEKRVAITSVASSPPPVNEGKKFIDSVSMLDYVTIIMGEESVQKWLDETIYSASDSAPAAENKIENKPESESAPEAETEQNSEICPPLLYEAISYFGINEETLIALDKTSEGAEYYLGEDAVRALYSQNWEALYKHESPPEISSEGE